MTLSRSGSACGAWEAPRKPSVWEKKPPVHVMHQRMNSADSLESEKQSLRQKFTKENVLRFFGINDLELRTLNFTELCLEKHPGQSWNDLTPVQQSTLIRDALKPQEILLDPQCTYLKYWDIVILSALIYTAIVTPYEVAFLQTSLNFLFGFNRCIDFVFVKDMVMQFYTKVQIQNMAGLVWISNKKTIRRRYLRSWFTIDLMSIMPFDTVGFLLANPEVSKLKVIRIVRLLRLLKLVRMLRASRIIKRWENRTSMSYSAQGLIKFTLLLVMITHWMGCMWGLLGYILATDLECAEDGSYRIQETSSGGSWITSRSWGPNSPCDALDAYLASAHFAVMTITSIGYGDIVPTRSEELGAGIICQLAGGLTWAYVIGSICGIISSANPVRVAFEQSMDALNSMLTEQNVDHDLRMQLREYLREQQYHHLLLRAREISNNFSSELQEALIPATLIGIALRKVWYFHDADPAFMVDVAHILVCLQHSPHEKIGGRGILCIMQRGSAVRNSRICLPGDFWGADMILTSQWLADPTQAIALNYIEVLSLRKDALDSILPDYPFMEVTIRKAATMIAFRNAIKMMIREHKKKKGEEVDTSPDQGAKLIGIFNRANSSPDTPSLMNMLNGETVSKVEVLEQIFASGESSPARLEIADSVRDDAAAGCNNSLGTSDLSRRLDRLENMLASLCIANDARVPDQVIMNVRHINNEAMAKLATINFAPSLPTEVSTPAELPRDSLPPKVEPSGVELESGIETQQPWTLPGVPE